MRKLGKKQLTLHLQQRMSVIPEGLSAWRLQLAAEGSELQYNFDAGAFDASGEATGIPALLGRMAELGIGYKDLNTRQSSLEDIFVSLVSERGGTRA
jgi:ABC-2 type transport system ATP-binding protein